MGTVLRQLLCGLLATSSLITLRAPSRASLLPLADDKRVTPIQRIFTDEVLTLVNEERAERNLEPLHRTATLDAAADERAQDMASRDYFAHISPDGVTPGDQILAAGYQPLLCGENIASGYSSAREVVRAWMASPSHRANILEWRFRDIGLAYTEAPGTESGVLWVQEFGEPRPDRTPRRSQKGPEHRTPHSERSHQARARSSVAVGA